nr:DegT/DnrJ/EryC1/StrS family aminotransferase [Thermoanaerobaculia bacterium]
ASSHLAAAALKALAGVDREALRLALAKEDIEARPVWKPMHLQPVFSACRCRRGEVAQRLFHHGLCLPSGSSLTDLDRERVLSVLLSAKPK